MVYWAESVEGSNHVKPIKQGNQETPVARSRFGKRYCVPAQLESDVAFGRCRWLEYKAGRRQST